MSRSKRRTLSGPGIAHVTQALEADGELVAELGRAIVAAARQTPPGNAAQPTKVLARSSSKSPAQLAHLRAGVDRGMRIAAGQRARRVPYQATGITAAAGYAAWGLSELAEAALGPAAQSPVIATTAGVCCAGLAGMRAYYRHGIPDGWRRRWWTAGIGAGSWVTAAAAFGPTSWTMTAVLAGGAAALSSGWLRAHEVPDLTATPAAAPLPELETPGDELGDLVALRWAANVSCQGGPVPGAWLSGRQNLPNLIRWLVETPPGKGNFDSLLASLPRIASGLKCSLNKLILEPVADDESAAWLSVITHDVLAEGVPYTGPRYLSDHKKDGRIPVGPHADGTGEACFVAVDEVGCRNGLVTGAPGSGKSACLETLALGYLSSGQWQVLFADGDPGGGSSPLLNRIAHWAEAGPERALAQLEWLENYLELRTALKATLTQGPDGAPTPITYPARQLPVREMLPSPDYPGTVWIVDELYRLTQDDWLKVHNFVARLEALTRIGRKYGIVVLAGTQSLLLDDYGSSSKLRSYLSDINCFAYRNRNRSEQHVVSGLRISPSTLPAGGGYGFTTAGGRMSMFRGAWAPDLSPFTAGLPMVTLDRDGQRLMRRYRSDESGDPEKLFAAAKARLKELRTSPEIHPDSAPAADHDREPRGVAFRPLQGIQLPKPISAADIIPINRAHRTTAEHKDPTDRLSAAGQNDSPPNRLSDVVSLTENQRTVHDTLVSLGTHQPARNAQIVDLNPTLADSTVSKALAALAELGLARKVGHGAWIAAPATNDDDERVG